MCWVDQDEEREAAAWGSRTQHPLGCPRKGLLCAATLNTNETLSPPVPNKELARAPAPGSF